VRNTSNATTGNRTTLRPVDFDGDGDLDLLSASDILDELAWWENDGAQNFTRHPLTASFNRPLDLMAASLDNDNDLDLVAAGPALAWYEETAAGDFLRHLFVGESAAVIDMVDLDGDGDLDIVNGGDSRIYWWENPKLP